MKPALISADAARDTSKGEFHFAEFKRIIALVWPYRTTLLLGLLSTLVFISLHTVSIGAAFPVFKTLLEEEGLHGWTDRTMAGMRLGVSFAAVGDGERLAVTKVESTSLLYEKGLRPGSSLWDEHGGAASELLHTLAYLEPGSTHLAQMSNTNVDGSQTVVLVPDELDFGGRLLRWGISYVPVQAKDQKLRTLTFLLTGLIVIVVVSNVFRFFGEVLVARSVLGAMLGLRTRLYAQTLQLPMSYFAGQPTADVVIRFVQDIQELQRGMMTLFGKFIREPLRAVSIMALAVIVDWRMTLTILVVMPIALVVFWSIGRSVKKANRKLLRAYGLMVGALTASLQNLNVVKAYTAEEHERRRIRGVDLRVFKQQLKLAKMQAFISPFVETLAVVMGSLVTIWLAGRVLNQEMEMAKFATIGLVLAVLFDPLRKLTDVYVRLQRSTAAAERIFSILDEPIESDYSCKDAELIELKPLERSIEYVGVSFTYPGADVPALRDVNLSIPRGETVAIVGPNGCGKTTLVNMLVRLYLPDVGEIHFDGVNIRSATLASLRKQIGLVTQDAIVFAGTPLENIAYGHLGADEAHARDAARRARAEEFIQKIPGGYQADLGERGSTLSGGQRQRLAIARAIFRDAPILIFDEATSQIDSESELQIQTALRELARDHTMFIIAHRLSTIQFADRIVVMDAGSIVDVGTHPELLERSNLYRNLCATQFLADPTED